MTNIKPTCWGIGQKKVFVYRNLHRKCWSVRDVKTRRVIGHYYRVVLEDAEFKVSEAGRQRVLREKRKNVHAGVQGTVPRTETPRLCPFRVRYNPYAGPNFTLDSGKSVKYAHKVVLTPTGQVFAA